MVLPILAAALLGCVALVMTRILRPEEVYHAINWQVIFLLAGVLPLGIAMNTSGVAGVMAEYAVGLVGDLGPVAVLAPSTCWPPHDRDDEQRGGGGATGSDRHLHRGADRSGSPAVPHGHHVCRLHRVLHTGRLPDQHHDLQPRGYKYTDFLRAGMPLNILFWILSSIFIPRLWAF